ncbi:flagellar biosynthetic protein FliO [Paraburkholderia unamae]|uniref:Flagellar protein n=1 Tax=Paraburkholderia unamae TaxID=219649 RepID=A0ABX5KX55_9BURK|nr:flagellar biosynthetic protein FliO [Paraburkholderia unamae]PVX97373.1 flagellar protein FliO/FliZ [Paraburkholderia unamae]CAG9253841.1 Flagellar biosynthesis protein fliO [Paraburkholderia unamae]
MNPQAVPGARLLRFSWRLAVHLSLAGAALLAVVSARAADLKAVNEATRAASGSAGASAVIAGSAVPALGFGAVVQTVLGLALVIGVVFGCAWLARRLGLQGGMKNALVRTVGGASLGGKERVAVVEIGDTWLVLGAAPGNVRLLHSMPAGELPAGVTGPATAGPALSGTFAQRFRDALKSESDKRFKTRFTRHDGGAQ